MLTYLSIGSNLGDKEDNINNAVSLLDKTVGAVCRRSSFYYSEPWGFNSENNFVNIVVAVDTELSPIDLLHATQNIERMLGRAEKTTDNVYTDRIIDIDIILYGNLHIDMPELKIPHPLMHLRNFVMVPLAEIQEK